MDVRTLRLYLIVEYRQLPYSTQSRVIVIVVDQVSQSDSVRVDFHPTIRYHV
jgi:hypothetical protein